VFYPPKGIKNPVLSNHTTSDISARLLADPFMLKHNNMLFMFFEVLNNKSRVGEIAMATSEDGFRWSYNQVVLAEPFHLSYPYVFQYQDRHFMIPESKSIGAIRLYTASEFPYKWSYTGTLLEGMSLEDSSIIYYFNKWFLFTCLRDELLLYFSEKLTGPYIPHPKSPIIKDPNIYRQGGRILPFENMLIRYAQNNRKTYGESVTAYGISKLTTTDYEERLLKEKILGPSGTGWNRDGMHHIDPVCVGKNLWIACVDGKRFERKRDTISYYIKRLLRF
jgi:hypothetical protein